MNTSVHPPYDEPVHRLLINRDVMLDHGYPVLTLAAATLIASERDNPRAEAITRGAMAILVEQGLFVESGPEAWDVVRNR